MAQRKSSVVSPETSVTRCSTSAREAFMQGLQVAALTAATVAVVTAVLAVVFLRRVGPGSGEEAAPRAPKAAVGAVQS